MSMIERYKKRGGFVQLVNLLETMGGEKRDKYLQMIASESSIWEAAIKQKMLTLDRMAKWDLQYLMEFMPELPAQSVAYAMSGISEEAKAKFLSALPFGPRKKVEDILKDSAPKPGEISASQMKIINEARSRIAQGKLKMDKCDPELAIPENFEEKLESSSSFSAAGVSSPTDAVADAAVVAAVNATPVPANSGALGEEVNLLRRKIVSLTQENNRLNKEVKEFREKVEAVKAALSKTAA